VADRRSLAIGAAVTALAVVAMAFDHLRGDDPGWEDPPAFFISVAICLAVAIGLFGFLIPRLRRDPDRAAKWGLGVGIFSVLSVALIWLGVPWIVGGSAIALGLIGRAGNRARLATAAIVLGAFTLVLCGVGSDWSSDS
jgi:peptidoglycan/LPS O-acetylase OafA/YrhL